MGTVYRGRDERIGGRLVAIKILNVSDEGLRDRFLREAGTAGTLNHRNIVTIYDYGEHEGQPYIIMEYVAGVTLADTIRSQAELSLTRKLEIMADLVDGLDYAHNKGVVHRDVKPANVMINHDDVVKILDFGIAHVADSSLTQIGTMMGTPNYMSPEQVAGRGVDRRSDIFSVGLVFYELLSYRQAFSGETLHHVLTAIVHHDPVRIGQLCPGLDPNIEAIVDRAIRKDPAQRYQTLAEFARDLATVGKSNKKTAVRWNSSATTVLTPPPSSPAPPSPSAGPATPVRRDTDLSKRRAERIERLLPVAQKAFDSGDFGAAIEACEEAALLNPEEPRVLSIMEQARIALDAQRVKGWLAEARRRLDEQNPDEASHLVERALALAPGSVEAQQVRQAVEAFKQRQEQDRERQRLIAAALVRAREGLSSGQFETAIRAAGEILIQDPTHQEAHELTREALRLLEERRRQAAIDKAAQTAVEQQQAVFSDGHPHEAIAALEGFAPVHPVVSAALAQMRRDLADIERRQAEEEERKRREAAEAERRRQAQERWVSGQLELARSLIDARQFGDAIEVLRHLGQVVAEVAGLGALLETALAGQAALEAEVRRARDIEQKLADAADARTHDQLTRARSLLDAVLELAPDHREAARRRKEVDAAIAERERAETAERAARAAVDDAQRQFDAGKRAEAIAALESFSPPHDFVSRARGELSAKLTAIQQAETEERALGEAERALTKNGFAEALRALDQVPSSSSRNERAQGIRARAHAGLDRQRRAEEQERRASAVAADARARFAAGDEKGALKLLERFSPPHAVTSQALAELQSEIAAREERERQLAEEQRRKFEEERTRRIDSACQEARAELAQGRYAEALDRLQRLERAEGKVPSVATLVQEAKAAQAAAEERRRSEERERQARAVAADARERFKAGDEKAALKLLEGFGPPHPVISQALSELRSAIVARQDREREVAEEQRRKLEEERTRRIDNACEEARAEISQGRYAEALDRLQRLERAEGKIPSVATLAQEAKAAQAAAEQQRRLEERDRQARELVAQARERFAAGDEKSPFKLLERFNPPHPVVSNALTELRAEVNLRHQRRQADEDRRRKEEDRRREACRKARDLIDRGRFLDAIRALQSLEQPEQSPEVRKLIAEAQAAQGAEQQRQEVKRQEEATQSLERERAIARAMARAREAPSAVDAVTFLREALQDDPNHVACRDMLAVRLAQVVADVERLVDDGQSDEALRVIDRVAALGLSTPALIELRERARSVPVGTPPGTPEPPRPVPPTPRPHFNRVPLWLGAAAAVLVAITLTYWLLRAPVARPSGGSGGPGPAGPDVPQIIAESEALLNQGELARAAHRIGEVPERASADPDVQREVQRIMGAADKKAATAKQSADDAHAAASQQDYVSATSHLESARRSRASAGSREASAVVAEYLAAEGSFERSSRDAERSALTVVEIRARARHLLTQYDLIGAADEAVAGLRRAPDDKDLKSTLQQTFNAADDRANTAKRAAGGPDPSKAAEYSRANEMLNAALNARSMTRIADAKPALDNAEPAIRNYLGAADTFMEVVTKHAQSLFAQGNYRDATHVAAAALSAVSTRSEFKEQVASLRNVLQQSVDKTRDLAVEARQSADNVNAKTRGQYISAASAFNSANNSKSAGQFEQAVQQYANAEALFRDAARLGNPDDTGSIGSGNTGPVKTIDISAFVRDAEHARQQGDLPQAAHAFATGLGQAPNNAQLTEGLRGVVDDAQKGANAAQRSAETAGASARAEYIQAARLVTLTNSTRAAGGGDAESEVRDYVKAEGLFKSAVSEMERDAKVTRDADTAKIHQLLDQVENAYDRLDSGQLSKLDPTLSVKALRDQFFYIKSEQYKCADRKITIQGDTATVSCTEKADTVGKRTGPAHQESPRTFTLRKGPDGWAIVAK
jgi:serine/threonine-protein kinase